MKKNVLITICSAGLLSAGAVSAGPVELTAGQMDEVTAGLSAAAMVTADAFASMIALAKASNTTLVTTSTPGVASVYGGQAAVAGGQASAVGVGEPSTTDTQANVGVDVAGGQYYGVEVSFQGQFVNASGAIVIGVTAPYNPLNP